MSLWRRTLNSQSIAGLRKSHDPLPLNTVLAQSTDAFLFRQNGCLTLQGNLFSPNITAVCE